ncbi:MAG: ATP-binding protein [Candidatus Altiarchaeota archaeon]
MENRKNRLRICIEEQWRNSLPEVKKRKTELKIKGDLINDVVGPRRAGKTSLMYSTIKKLREKEERKAIIYINFENRKLFPLNPEYFNYLVEIIHEEGLLDKSGQIYVFLDEVQKIQGWENYVRSIYDEFKGRIKIFISGSTSKLTKSKLSHLLTGRHLTTLVFPLSFAEYLEFNGVEYRGIVTEKERAKIEKHLKQYLTLGGFPEVVLTKNDELIETLLLDVINRDITPKVKHKEVVEDIAYFLTSYVAKLTSFTKLSKLLKNRGIKVSVPTLEKYFWLMKDSFIFFDTQIFSYKAKDQLQYPRKIYCIDNGFVNYFGFKFSEDKGRMLENSVAIHLYRESLENKKTKMYYWKSKEGYEVDFVLKEGLKVKQLIQACWDTSDYDTHKRETKALFKAGEELQCNNLLVITENCEGREKVKGKTIRYTPLWKWLLAKNSR